MKLRKMFGVLFAIAMLITTLPTTFAASPDAVPNAAHLAPAAPAYVGSPRMKTYFNNLSIPTGNGYTTLDSNVELAEDQSVTVTGAWDPSYATIWVMLERTDGTQWSKSVGLASTGTYTFTIPATGKYALKVSSLSYDVTNGQLQVTW